MTNNIVKKHASKPALAEADKTNKIHNNKNNQLVFFKKPT